MQLYHRTTRRNAARILEHGFSDATGYYGIGRETSGVWLSNVPLDENNGAQGDALLIVEIALPESELSAFEWAEEGKPYREFQVPAVLINGHAVVKIDELDMFEIMNHRLRRVIWMIESNTAA